MKVVLFCGGFGMRMREYSETVPKPMVPIGYRPVLWHLMRYYAHFGHNDFILCLGYQGDVIKEYFLDYKEWLSNDFVLREGGRQVDLLQRDIQDWAITFVDTGMKANIGERLLAVRDHLGDDETFLANYADGLTDARLDKIIAQHHESGDVATFLSVRPIHTFHIVDMGDDGNVRGLREARDAGVWMNGGFFVLDRRIFDFINPGEELVYEPFGRLIGDGLLGTYRHDGFWMGMDTFKDRETLNDMYQHGEAVWEVWEGEDPGV